jgi:TetR/AcrR family transcriptional regulator, cholesterol catabolism regulator
MEQKKKRNKRDERRKEILRIATKLFANKGYDGASLSDVAAEMDITKAALYHHITNKEDILKTICDEVLDKQMRETRKLVKSNLSPRDKLRWFIREVVRGVTEDQDVMRVYFESTNSLSAEAHEKVQKQKKAFDNVLELILKEGVKKGYFHIRDTKIAVFVIQGACNFAYQWYQAGGRLTPEEIGEEVIYLLERGYLEQNSESRTVQMRNLE